MSKCLDISALTFQASKWRAGKNQNQDIYSDFKIYSGILSFLPEFYSTFFFFLKKSTEDFPPQVKYWAFYTEMKKGPEAF